MRQVRLKHDPLSFCVCVCVCVCVCRGGSREHVACVRVEGFKKKRRDGGASGMQEEEEEEEEEGGSQLS